MTQFGVVLPSWGHYGDGGALRDLAATAEALGYHTAWFGDHVAIPAYAAPFSTPRWLDALTCCAMGAAWTTQLRFGTDVLVLPYRNPVVLAKTVASVDRLSGGRITLGVGVGYVSGEFAAVDAPPYDARGAVTDEYLAVLRLLWESEGAVSHAGDHVRFEAIHSEPSPLQRPLPVLVGGNGPRALRRAARLGEGWHPLFPTPEAYRAGRATIEALRAEHDRTDLPFLFSYSCPPTALVDDRSELPPPADFRTLPDLPAEYHYAPPVPTAPDGRPRFSGTADDVAGDIATFVDAGVQHFALRFWAGSPTVTIEDQVDQMRRFAELVALRFT